MKVELVRRIRGATGKTLVRDDIAFPVVPQVGDGVIWNGEWAVEVCIYRYVGPDSVEVGLTPCDESEVASLVAGGWTVR